MKIEKVNDNQIRCTLTREDLEERQLKISEIAYGSEKAKMLFKDVMQQANYEYGFVADNIPLMIEAIPMNTGCIVFIITKVEDPEELDTRFSRFSPSVHDEDEEDDDELSFDDDSNVMDSLPQTAEEVFDLFKKITSKAKEMSKNKEGSLAIPEKSDEQKGNRSNNKEAKPIPSVRLYLFDTIDSLVEACKIISSYYKGESSLYKDKVSQKYHLLLRRGLFDEKEFVKICNSLMEYASPEQTTDATLAFVDEHFDVLVEDKAVQNMALL